MKYILDGTIKNKRVLLRLDLNVTIINNKIVDSTKIDSSIKTINYLLNNNNKLIILSHLGKIKCEEDKKKNSLEIVYIYLKNIFGERISFYNTTRPEDIDLNNYDIALLENTRFEDFPEKFESNCSEELSKYWSSLADVYVNDAFATSHRKHASTYGVSKYMDSYYGLLFKEELEGLSLLISGTIKPYTIIMGGAKVDDKLELIDNLLKKCDYLLLGGGIANSFLFSLGYNVGSSLCNKDLKEKLFNIYNNNKDKIKLPVDFVVENNKKVITRKQDEIEEEDIIYDIGDETINIYCDLIDKSKLVFINGTVGLYENEVYSHGTKHILEHISKKDILKIVGGGDALSSVNKFKLKDKFSFTSTGGGATLEYLATDKISVFENTL